MGRRRGGRRVRAGARSNRCASAHPLCSSTATRSLPPEQLGGLVRRDGRFDDHQLRAGLRFFLMRDARGRLTAEIRAQFEAFRATGLTLDHVNAA